MESRENPIFGRKVYFLNPPLSVENQIIEALKELEYEVFIIKDYKYAKPVLRENKNAICFVYLDEVLTLKAWFNFLKSFSKDESLKTIFLGITSMKTSVDINNFIVNLQLPGGYVPINTVGDIALKKFIGILDLNGAKGRRQYIRLDCKGLKSVTGYITFGNKLFPINVENISSVGLACTYEFAAAAAFTKNSIINNVALSLGRWSVVVACVVFDVKKINSKDVAVLLFMKETPKEIRKSIRHFIFEILTDREKELMNSSIQDLTDYNISIKEEENDIPDYIVETPAVNDSEISELEEIKEN